MAGRQTGDKQTNILTMDGLVYWRSYASLGLNEVMYAKR